MFNDTLVDSTIWMLRKAFKNNKAKIWKALEKEFQKSRSNRRLVNIQKLNKVTNNGDVIIIPGKVLGNGTLGHKLTVCAYSFSETALNKLNASGTEVISLQSLINRHPDGKGVKIIG
jgi:large subunit ribosomal protein L18e